MNVARYHFPGSEEDFPLEMVPKLLVGFPGQITCNTAFCMIPKKSVAFVAIITLYHPKTLLIANPVYTLYWAKRR